MAIDPPYPSDLEAKGWNLDLDYERIERSDTWAIASPEQRPWLLMLWMIAWRQSPVASLPNNDNLIAARIGMPLERFAAWRDVLMSGWDLATDGRLYHRTLTNHALKMAEKRNKDRARVAAFRAKSQSVDPCNALHTRESPVSSTPTPTPTPREKDKEHSPMEPAGVSSSGNPKPGELFPDVPKDILRDYMAIRKTRRSPLTKTAADILKSEARKAGISDADMLRTCCENSWLGFKASWMSGDKPRRSEDVQPARVFRELSL